MDNGVCGLQPLCGATSGLLEAVSPSRAEVTGLNLSNISDNLNMNGQHPHLTSYVQAAENQISGFVPNIDGMDMPVPAEPINYLANAMPHGMGIPNAALHDNRLPPQYTLPIYTPTSFTGYHGDTQLQSTSSVLYQHTLSSPYPTSLYTPTSLAAYSTGMPSYPLPPISTAPSLLFRSPASFSQTVCSTGMFQFSSPTISSPPIQMMAPLSGQTNSVMSSMWQHTVPSTIPWGISTSSVQTFSATPTRTSIQSTVLIDAEAGPSHVTLGRRGPKRRMTSQEKEFDMPRKVCINEETMAARMQELTLDNNNLDWHPNLEEEWLREGSDTDEDDQCTSSSNSIDSDLPQLEISNILKVGLQTKEILPKLILDEINKPCMQLVLWKPPDEFVKEAITGINNETASSGEIMAINGDTNGVTSSAWNSMEGSDQCAGPVCIDDCLDVDLPDDDDEDMDL